MPGWLAASRWLVASHGGAAIGLAMFLGAVVAWFAELSHRQIASVMTFGGNLFNE